MKRPAALMLLHAALLASCAPSAPQPAGAAPVTGPGAACRVGPGGGPPRTERGIGGTGTPASQRITDRGIGGTGIEPIGFAQGANDRTGIIGVVTGFASICLDGLELRFDSAAAVDIDGTAATAGQLRVGQLVLVEATGVADASTGATAAVASALPTAHLISVRHEVAGPVEAVDAGAGALMIAGQRVMVPHAAGSADHPGVGDWVSVSGQRQADGTIYASRLDSAPAGMLMVRGQVSRRGGKPSIGRLALAGRQAAGSTPALFVTISGRYRAGSAEVTSIAADGLRADPMTYFGSAVKKLILQDFIRVDHNRAWLASGQAIAAGPAVPASGGTYRDAVVSLERGADGGVTVTSLRYTDGRGLPTGVSSAAGVFGTGRTAAPRVATRSKPAPSAARGDDRETAWDGAPEGRPVLVSAPAPEASAPTPLVPVPPPVATPPVPPPEPTPPVMTPAVATQPMAARPGVMSPPPAAPGKPAMQGHGPASVAMIQPRKPKHPSEAGPGTGRAGASAATVGPRAIPTTVFTAASTVAPAAPGATTGTPGTAPSPTLNPPDSR